MGATFDLWQQAFVLASMSGAGSSQQGTPDTLASELENTFKTFFSSQETIADIGKWSIAWGPVIFESNPSPQSYADNTMYVAANADKTVYVVSIAGTNPNSSYDIYQEDLQVQTTVAWTSAFGGSTPSGLNPYISTGTELGVNNLLGMTDTQTNQTLLQFLQSLSASGTQNSKLIFGGHSLAGALAPTLALAFFNPAGGKLKLSDWSAVYLYPTAGPTPGNADFGTFLSSVFPAISSTGPSYQVWNQNVWNSIDVVPHAWTIPMLEEIPTLYPASWSSGSEPDTLRFAIWYAKTLSNKGAGTGAGPYEQYANQSIPGTVDKNISVKDLKSFEDQALYQHTTAYDILLGVQSLMPTTKYQAAYRPAVHAILSPRSAGEQRSLATNRALSQLEA